MVPKGKGDPKGSAEGIVAVALVNLHAEDCFGMPSIEADNWEPYLLQPVPQPGRQGPRLKTDANRARSMSPDSGSDIFRRRGGSPPPQGFSLTIHHADMCQL